MQRLAQIGLYAYAFTQAVYRAVRKSWIHNYPEYRVFNFLAVSHACDFRSLSFIVLFLLFLICSLYSVTFWPTKSKALID